MTDNLINTLQAYFGKAIRENTDSVDAMKQAIKAIYYHKSSTDKDNNHSFCPIGVNSWCKFNRAQAKGESYKHPSTPNKCVWEEVRPVLVDLCNDDLLVRCIGGHSQNINESLNARIWKFAPKKLFSGPDSLKTAAYLAVALFNEGAPALDKILRELDVEPGPRCREFCIEMDRRRLKQSQKGKKSSNTTTGDDERGEEEEIFYGPGIAE